MKKAKKQTYCYVNPLWLIAALPFALIVIVLQLIVFFMGSILLFFYVVKSFMLEDKKHNQWQEFMKEFDDLYNCMRLIK